jgi:hypothetical protein
MGTRRRAARELVAPIAAPAANWHREKRESFDLRTAVRRDDHATPARSRSWKCTMPTGRPLSTTISAVIFEELSSASASLAN